MNHPWDILADFIGRTIAERWAATRTNPPTAPSGTETALNSDNKNEGTTAGNAENSLKKTSATSKQADVDL